MGQVFTALALADAVKKKVKLRTSLAKAALGRAIVVLSGLGPLLIFVDAVATIMLHANKFSSHKLRLSRPLRAQVGAR